MNEIEIEIENIMMRDDDAIIIFIMMLCDDIDELMNDDQYSRDIINAFIPIFDMINQPESSMIQYRSILCLENSICPIHRCDYAICFDDDDDECAQLRAAFPLCDS
jgi:hypothetical protein